MANSINIPIEIVTKEALLEIKKFSKVASDNLSEINKTTKEYNELLVESNKSLQVLSSTEKSFAAVAGSIGVILLAQNTQSQKLIKTITGLNISYLRNVSVIDRLFTSVQKTAKITGVFAASTVLLDKGIIGLALNLSTASLGLYGLGRATELVDNEVINLVGSFAKLASLITGTLSAGLILLIQGTANLSIAIGETLVNSTKSAIESFVTFEEKTFVFKRTLEGFSKAFGDSIGTVESWTKSIEQISTATGFTEKALRGAATEIIATTSAMGFNELQQKKLLQVATDYASILGGNVVQTSIEFVSALNGQTQSVQKYGVKLNQAYLQNLLYNQGISRTINSLTENEKVQLRFNSLLKQYKPIAGNAADTTRTLAGQQRVLENNLTRLSQSFGEGAAVIESNMLAAAGMNAVLNNVNKTVVQSAGFFTALAGRIFEVGGFVLKASFNILALYKILTIINSFLETNLLNSIINLPFPFFKKSIADLIKSMGVSFVSFSSLGAVIKTFTSILFSQLLLVINGLTGVSLAAINTSNIFNNIFIKSLAAASIGLDFLKKAATSTGNAIKNVLIKSIYASILALKALNIVAIITGSILKSIALNPVVIALTAVTVAIQILYNAFVEIEKQTKVFDVLLEVIGEVLTAVVGYFIDAIKPILDFLESFELFAPIAKFFRRQLLRIETTFKSFIANIKDLKTAIINLATKPFGVLIAALSKFLSFSIELLNNNPFNIFSKTQLDKLNSAKERLDNLSKSLTKANYNFSEISKTSNESSTNIERNLASVSEAADNVDLGKIGDSLGKIDLGPLLELKKELVDVGLTDIDKLVKQRDERLAIIADALKSEGKALKIAKELELKINQDYNDQVGEITRQASEKSLESMENFRKNILTISTDVKEALGTSGQSIESALSFQFGGKQDIAKNIENELITAKEQLDTEIIDPETYKLRKKDLKQQKKDLEKNAKLAIGTGIANSFAQGSAGATSLVTGLGGLVADSFVPGMGKAVGPLLEVFAQGPEATKQAFNEFAQTVPTVIENLILAIPAAIEALADNVDIIIFRIVDRLDEIIIALVKAMPRVSIALALAMAIDVPIALAKSMPSVVWSLIKELTKALPQAFIDAIRQIVGEFYNLGKSVFQGFWDGVVSIGTFFYDLGKSIFQGFKDSISSLGELNPGGGGVGGTFINTLIGGAVGGGVGSVIGAIGGSFGFAKGGMIPNGFSNDTFPTRLSSGELVVDRSTTRDLQEFLSLQSSPSTSSDNTTGLLSEIVTLLSREQSIETSVDFNDNTLAKIILNLSRNNARLA